MRSADVTVAAVSREALARESQREKRAVRTPRAPGLGGGGRGLAGLYSPCRVARTNSGCVRPRMARATLMRTRRGLRGGSCGETGGAERRPADSDSLVPAPGGLLSAAAARGAGRAARRRDVTGAPAVVGAGSAAAKCELRRARAGGSEE